MVAEAKSRAIISGLSRPSAPQPTPANSFRTNTKHSMKNANPERATRVEGSQPLSSLESTLAKSMTLSTSRINTSKIALFNPLWNQHLQKMGRGEGLMVNQTSSPHPHLERTDHNERSLFRLPCKPPNPFRTNPRRPLHPSLLGARIGLIRGTGSLSSVSNRNDSGPRVAPLPRLPKSAKGPRLFLAGRMIRPSWRGASREAGRKGRQCPIG